ncbi:alpha-L-fucosidase [uncultured Methylobacterium sp.]|uniref:alpha-L-fucosidase n=1 Tax=uncultured Methylobacterium sp. TaxID=157278 RepID=UPI0035CB778E
MKVNVLIDNHLHAGMNSYLLPDLRVEEMEKFVDSVRPTRLTVFAVGHDGLAQYPSKVAKIAPDLAVDLVGLWQGIARSRKISFGIYVSTLRNDVLLEAHPSWIRMRLDGMTSGKIDHASPFLEEWLKPVLKELYDRYRPDSFFFDGDYWAVGESTSIWRCKKAVAARPDCDMNAFSAMNAREHRLLTVDTYSEYNQSLGKFLHSLDEKLLSSINLAFTFRHPTSPPIGLNLVTSDLPPFYGALEAWIETAVRLRSNTNRDLVVPLYAEPEGGGRKYPKNVQQLIHEIAPLIANDDPIHVYFPMSRLGSIDQTYVGKLNELRSIVEDEERKSDQPALTADYDVICLSDSQALQLSQDFSCVRGAYLAASAAGLNVGITSTERYLEDFQRTRLLILPAGRAESPEAHSCVAAAIEAGITVLGPSEIDFENRMIRSNWDLSSETISLLGNAYTMSRNPTLWSNLRVTRPWTTFVRGFVAVDESRRLFLWNGIKSGSNMGRHVRDEGAGLAGHHNVRLPIGHSITKIWGQVSHVIQLSGEAAFNLNGAFAVVEFEATG